ncbi:MAG TPA: ATP-binding protein [Myxococcaceae bacterium]|nr:ATP-binding protein [Myxococcaceae bacterium]
MRGVQSLNLWWFLRLRWGAIAAQLLIFFAGDRLMSVAVPVGPMLLIIAIEIASNLGFMLWARPAEAVPEWTVAALMALDTVLLSALLYVTGGDSKTFAVLYLVNIALAAVLLDPLWTWILTIFTAICFGALVVASARAPAQDLSSDPLEWQLRELWLAYAVAAALIVYFVQRTVRMHRDLQAAAELLRQSAERREKLASLATLAAGAAHELATPLSTIAIISKELEHQLERSTPPASAIQDARLIRQEVERCRTILTQMAADAGTNAAEPLEKLSIEKVIERSLTLLAERDRVQLSIAPSALGRSLDVPPRALSQALHALLKNALQASMNGDVALRVTAQVNALRIAVADGGPGMSADTLARAGEPFFTTKEPGRGMGLGLFLSRSLVEQLGGTLEIASAIGRGTEATIVLPFQ